MLGKAAPIMVFHVADEEGVTAIGSQFGVLGFNYCRSADEEGVIIVTVRTVGWGKLLFGAFLRRSSGCE